MRITAPMLMYMLPPFFGEEHVPAPYCSANLAGGGVQRYWSP
jgi:hypothetical protein